MILIALYAASALGVAVLGGYLVVAFMVHKAPEVEVPGIAGMTLIEALDELSELGLDLEVRDFVHSGEIAEKMVEAAATEEKINQSRESYRPVAARGSLMFFLLSELNKIHSFHHYSLNCFIIVFQTAVTGKRQRVTWNTTGNALLDMILPKKRKGLFAKINLKKVIASNQSPEELQKRLDYLLENITYQVFNFSRRGLFDAKLWITAEPPCHRCTKHLPQPMATRLP